MGGGNSLINLKYMEVSHTGYASNNPVTVQIPGKPVCVICGYNKDYITLGVYAANGPLEGTAYNYSPFVDVTFGENSITYNWKANHSNIKFAVVYEEK